MHSIYLYWDLFYCLHVMRLGSALFNMNLSLKDFHKTSKKEVYAMKFKAPIFPLRVFYSFLAIMVLVTSFAPSSYGLQPFTDDFESGNLNNWTIGGRQLYGTNIANVVNCGTGSMCGHLFHDSFTEINMYRDFLYDPNDSGTFYFDLEVDVYSQAPPAANYYGMAGVVFSFLDTSGSALGDVRYVAATTNYPFTLGTATSSVNQISENVMEHYELNVSDMLSQISIDETQVTDIRMLMVTYSSTAPYPYVSTELWIDNVSTTVVPEPISSTLFIVGGATLGFRRFRKKFKK